jgi:hypothetical protein
MNKYEVIGMFTALDELYEAQQYERLGKVIKKTLAAAEGKDTKKSGEKESKDEN